MTLHIASHPVTREELADLRALLLADVEPAVRGACECPDCDCIAAAPGGGRCRACEAGDCLWPVDLGGEA